MLILEIAAGVVLGVLALCFLQYIIAFALWAIIAAICVVGIVIIGSVFSWQFVFWSIAAIVVVAICSNEHWQKQTHKELERTAWNSFRVNEAELIQEWESTPEFALLKTDEQRKKGYRKFIDQKWAAFYPARRYSWY